MIEAWLCSAVVFRLSLHSCSALSRILRISANQHLLSFPLGALSVGLSGSAAAATYQLLVHNTPPQFSSKDIIVHSLASIIAFRVAGGSFKWICCADLFKPGPFAIDSVPALLNQAVSAEQRRTIQSIGGKHGCHSCGMFMMRRKNRYIADHIPPSHLMRNSIRSTWTSAQRLYPHCVKCAAVQGAAVSWSKRTIVTPALWGNWRLAYVWLPTPVILEQIYARMV